MGKLIILLTYILLAISCDDRCGDTIDQGYVENKTDSQVKLIEFFAQYSADSVIIEIGKSTFIQITQNYEYLNERLDSVIFEKDSKSITYRNRKYGSGLSIANYYFNIDSWKKKEKCRGIAFDFEYAIQNIDFD